MTTVRGTAGDERVLGVDRPAWLVRLSSAHQRRARLAAWPVPDRLVDRALAPWPGLTTGDRAQALAGFRQFLLAAFDGMDQPGGAAMPSELVDAVWHESILHTRQYERMCLQTFGRVLHHTPTPFMGRGEAVASRTYGVARSYVVACREQGIAVGSGLPALFAADQDAGIPDGQRWTADCGAAGGPCGFPDGKECLSCLVLSYGPARTGAKAGDGGSSFGPVADGGGDGGSGCGGGGCGGGS